MAEKIVINDPELEKRVDKIVSQLRECYPDGKVIGLNRQHKSLSNRVGVIWQELGYESRDDFFEVYGFEFVNTEKSGAGSKGGRPVTTDPEAIISELMDRYEGMDKPKTIGILIYENPDMKGQIKTLQNKANELFGQTLAKELKARGLLSGGSKAEDVSEDAIRELLDTLAAKYADAPIKPNSMSELKADNPDSKDVLTAFNDRCRLIFGITARKKLVELGIFEKPKGAVIDTSEDEINQAIDEIASYVMDLNDDDKPKTLSDLQKAYPEQGEYIKAGKKMGVVDKGPLQQIGILAPTRALLKREGVRRAPVESLADDYASLGRPKLIKPDDDDAALLPPNVAGIDIEAKVELREFIATAKGASAKSLSVGDNVAIDVVHERHMWGDPYVAIRIQTMPLFNVELGLLSNDAINNSSSPLSTCIGGEVLSVSHGEDFDAAQIQVRYLAELSGGTLAYLFRSIGIVTEKDVRGSMEWRYRLKKEQQLADTDSFSERKDDNTQVEIENEKGDEAQAAEIELAPIKIEFANKARSTLNIQASVKGDKGSPVEILPPSDAGIPQEPKALDDTATSVGDSAEECERLEAEERARKEAEERARREVEERARKEAEEAAQRAEEERKRKEAEEAEKKRIEEEKRKAEEAAQKAEEEERRRQEEETAKKEEEKAQAQKRFSELDEKIKSAEKRKASLSKPVETASEKEAAKISAEIARMEAELNSLGFFARSKKKELQNSIAAKQSSLSSVKTRIAAERDEAESKRKASLSEVNSEITALLTEIAPYKAIILEDVTKAFEGKKTGDTVLFGSCKQESSSVKATPIEWIVLEAQGGRLLLLSKKVLANRKFNNSKSSANSYATSDLCKWLAGAFAADAFSPVDRQILVGDPYILDASELKKYLRSDSDRQCEPTELAKSQGAEAASMGKAAGNAFYWVATPEGNESFYYVNPHGVVMGGGGTAFVDGMSIGNYGQEATYESGVRPAVLVQIR